MNTHEHDHENENEAGRELHELLCAHVFGELEGADRERIEQALADSAELREERARIEATVGLVKNAYSQVDGLPADVLRNLEAQADTRRRGPVLSMKSLVRLAATLLVAMGGIIALRSTLSEDEDPNETIVAVIPTEGRPIMRLTTAGELRVKRDVIYDPSDAEDYDELRTWLNDVAVQLEKDVDLREMPGEPLLIRADGNANFNHVQQLLQESGYEDVQTWKMQLAVAEPSSGSYSKETLDHFHDLGLDAGGYLPAERGDELVAYLETLDEAQQKLDSTWDAGRKRPGTESAAGSAPEGALHALAYAGTSGEESVASVEGETLLMDQFKADGSRAAVDPSTSRPNDSRVSGAQPVPVLEPAPADREVAGKPADKKLEDGTKLAYGRRKGKQSKSPEKNAAGAPSSQYTPSSVSGPSTPGPATPGAPTSQGGSRYATTGSAHGGGGTYRGPGSVVPPGGGGGGGGGAAAPAGPLPPARGSARDGKLSPPSEELARRRTELGKPADQPQAEVDKDSPDVAKVGLVVEDLEVEYEGGDDDFFLGHGLRERGEKRPRTEAELEALAQERARRILSGCRRLPHEKPSMMFFRFWGDNAFELAHLDPLSTFSVDVDTASYALARRYLRDGYLPEKAQIRTEEFVNYFRPDLPAPTESVFGIHTELAPSRFGTDNLSYYNTPAAKDRQRWMLRVGVRGKEISREERKPLQLTFVVDTSGSMKQQNRMELVKHALRLLMTELDTRDSIGLVAFSNEARLILPMTSVANRGLIEAAIYGLQPDGGTNAEAGLWMGYELAANTIAIGATSRVVLLSDGVANVGETDQNRIATDVKRFRDRGIYLNTVGVGMGNHNDVFLEQLANKGDGLCNYVDSAQEARRALVDNFTGAFEAIARDVKIQVEFDPQQVHRYRLLGYENRAIADVDFRNDKVDAGEVGAGHQVVALYELELSGQPAEEPLATVRLRWKAPSGVERHPLEDAATEVAHPVLYASATSFPGTSRGYKRSVFAAQFAEILRGSIHARGDSLDELIAETGRIDNVPEDTDVRELIGMMEKARILKLQHPHHRTPLDDCVDLVRRNRYLEATWRDRQHNRNDEILAELERRNADIERRIHDLIRDEIRQELK